jgi:hypothetical protein
LNFKVVLIFVASYTAELAVLMFNFKVVLIFVASYTAELAVLMFSKHLAEPAVTWDKILANPKLQVRWVPKWACD